MWKMEGLFAEAKQNHGLARARYRGRSKVQIQAYLSATAQNLKRLVFLFCCWLITWRSYRPRSPAFAGPIVPQLDFFNTPDPFLKLWQDRQAHQYGGLFALGYRVASSQMT